MQAKLSWSKILIKRPHAQMRSLLQCALQIDLYPELIVAFGSHLNVCSAMLHHVNTRVWLIRAHGQTRDQILSWFQGLSTTSPKRNILTPIDQELTCILAYDGICPTKVPGSCIPNPSLCFRASLKHIPIFKPSHSKRLHGTWHIELLLWTPIGMHVWSTHLLLWYAWTCVWNLILQCYVFELPISRSSQVSTWLLVATVWQVSGGAVLP